MNKHTELFSELKDSLNTAPVEVKEAYNKVVTFFDRKRSYEPILIDCSENEELSFFLRFGIKKVLRIMNAHGGIVYLWYIRNPKDDHGDNAALGGIGYLSNWDPAMWDKKGNCKTGNPDESWDDLFRIDYDSLKDFYDDVKDNAWVDASNYKGDTERIHDYMMNRLGTDKQGDFR